MLKTVEIGNYRRMHQGNRNLVASHSLHGPIVKGRKLDSHQRRGLVSGSLCIEVLKNNRSIIEREEPVSPR